MTKTPEEIEARIKAFNEIGALDFTTRGGFSETDAFYLSFADPRRPKGTQWLGGCYSRAESFEEAMVLSRVLNIKPGGEVQGTGPFPAKALKRDFEHRLLTTEEDINEAIDDDLL